MASPASTLDWKIVRWQQNLLDLTLRNRLLNFKARWAVQVVRPDANRTFDRLVNEGHVLVVREMTEQESAASASVRLADREILAAFDPRGVGSALKKMRLKARGAIQEQGVNILYAAFGMLRWYEDDSSGIELQAPLVLVPVELTRDGPLGPFRLRAIEEDIVVNPTLAFKLSTDYRLSLPEWPEENITLPDYLKEAALAVAPMQRWRVDESVFLGLFSFAKLSMYQEMETSKAMIASHPVLNALAGDPSLLPPVPAYPVGEQLDAAAGAEGSFQILDADSSQQEAIEMAKRGISFVLQGPPGTGKSQTIANIIAESLAMGKKVLFVSEKMAALEVVKRRLDDRGLGEHILELHSHKANKSAVIEELRRSVLPEPVPAAGPEDVERLVRARTSLNEYVRALHEERGPLGRSAFFVHGRLAALATMPELPVPIPRAAAMKLGDLDDDLRTVRRVQVLQEPIGRMDGHAWSDLRTERWSAGDEALVASSLHELRTSIGRVRERSAVLSELSGVDQVRSLLDATRLAERMQRASSTPYPPASWLSSNRPESLLIKLDEVRSYYSSQAEYSAWFGQNYQEGLLSLDTYAMLGRFELKYRSFLRFLNRSYKQDLAELQGFVRGSRRLNYAGALADLRRIHNGRDGEKRKRAVEDDASQSFGLRFKGERTDWSELRSSLLWTSVFLRDHGGALTPQMINILSDPRGAAPRLSGPVQEALNETVRLQLALDQVQGRFLFRDVLSTPQAVSFDNYEAFADRHLAALPSLKEWVEVSGLEKACGERGLGELFDLARRRSLPPADLMAGYEKRFYRIWLDQLYAGDARLRDFRSEEHEETIRLFRQLDQEQMVAAQKRLRAKLDAIRSLSVNAPEAKGTELSILKHELNKKKRFKQIRQLFADCPHIIMELRPCLLMSPLSVSQFLDPGLVRFDVVIFDEASQVRPEDAVGSIMRGAQVIVVGDSKQLPPTTFFKAATEDEEEEELEDLESILDECSAIGVRQHMLQWHYRSRHESLIAFSNRHIYGGRLYTFPSAVRDRGEWGVSFVHVPDGVYDRGGAKTNPVEAKKVAELVFEHFARSPQRSLGVVAFSEAQQMAIIDQVEKMRESRPELEPFFLEGGSEDFFVKNLENVQGDERDVIIFSVGYGKDARGRMVQNFGPLNKAGGERRLNVAITRARMHVKLVASIRAEDIEGSATRGTALLKDYMSYAAAGGSGAALGDRKDKGDATDSPFEEEVFKALTAEGFKLQKQVGCSGYRIDLAIEDPDAPDSFVLGIECDGASYRSGRTARDRDRLREQVLVGLGWKIHRIWSRDWVNDPRREVEKVRAAWEAAGGTWPA